MDAVTGLLDLDDGTLVRRAQGGDRAAVAALVERHYPLVHGCSYRRLGNRADAEDVTQDVMAKLGRALVTLKEPAALRGYLLKLTINAATDLFRARKRNTLGTASFFADPTTAPHDSDDEDQIAELWSAVRRLPDQQRDAILLVYADGASHREAAQALGVAEATISYHVHAGRKRLKDMLKEDAS